MSDIEYSIDSICKLILLEERNKVISNWHFRLLWDLEDSENKIRNSIKLLLIYEGMRTSIEGKNIRKWDNTINGNLW